MLTPLILPPAIAFRLRRRYDDYYMALLRHAMTYDTAP